MVRGLQNSGARRNSNMKEILKYSLLLIGGLALGFSSSVMAAKSLPQVDLRSEVENVKKACKQDIDTLCSDVTPGKGHIAACLKSKFDQLSGGCVTAYNAAEAKVSDAMDKVQLSFRDNCGTDIQKFCKTVPAGKGRVLSCLNSNQEGLSGSCRDLIAQVDARVAQAVG